MYHLYRQYFPLLALTTYAKVMEKSILCGEGVFRSGCSQANF
jgi:hypothetical protein